MKCKVHLWLLFLLLKIITSNGYATTARYNISVDNFLINQKGISSTFELNHTNPSNYTDYGRKLKHRQHAVKIISGNGTLPNYVRVKTESKNNTNAINKSIVNRPTSSKLPQKLTQVLKNNSKNSSSTLVNKRVKLRPKIRIQSTTRIPKITSRPSSLKKKTVVRNSSNHYKNYTKFRIKPPLEKQNPMPEITLHSPEYSIGEITGLDSVVVDAVSSTETFPYGVPVSQVLIQSVPLNDNQESLGSDCPTFQLSSYVYSPQLKQNCPDLNVVINSQLSQNTITERLPEIQADDPAVEEEVANPFPLVSDEVPANAAAAPAAETNSGGSGTNPGAGGNPIGFPELPSLPELPDLKGLFDFLGLAWRFLSGVFRFLGNPYLYLVPAGISFAIGFLKVLSLIPWWAIPVGFYFARKDDNKPNVAYYKHIHPPVHHYDEWFWNQNTKTWTSVFDYNEKVDRKPIVPKLVRVNISDED